MEANASAKMTKPRRHAERLQVKVLTGDGTCGSNGLDIRAPEACINQRAVIVGTVRVSSPLTSILQSTGYEITDSKLTRMSLERQAECSDAIILPASLGTLRHAFGIVHRVNARRFSPEAAPFLAEIFVIATAHFSAGTVVDFREQGCRIVYDMPAAIFEELTILRVERQRLLQRGVMLLWVPPVPGCLPRVFLVGLNGRQSEMDLNAKETHLLRKLASERRSFGQPELETEIGCGHGHLRTHVQRLREEYERCRQEVGIMMSMKEFITNPGRGLGYRLHARVKNVC